jgi:hypothetical protein
MKRYALIALLLLLVLPLQAQAATTIVTQGATTTVTFSGVWQGRPYHNVATVPTYAIAALTRQMMRPMLANHNAVACYAAIRTYDQSVTTFASALVAFAALSGATVGSIDALIAAGALFQWATGLSLGGAAATLMGLYTSEKIAENSMDLTCGS